MDYSVHSDFWRFINHLLTYLLNVVGIFVPSELCKRSRGENTLRNAEYGVQNSTTYALRNYRCGVRRAAYSAICWQ